MTHSCALYGIRNNDEKSVSIAVIQNEQIVFIHVFLRQIKLCVIKYYDKNFPEMTINYETEENNEIKSNGVKIIGNDSDIRKLVQGIGFNLIEIRY